MEGNIKGDTMPQLVKGGKYVYGWSKVGDTGKIVIPPDAVEEYNLRDGEKVILMPGSSCLGGFGITTVERLQNSLLDSMVAPFLETDFTIPEGDDTGENWKPYKKQPIKVLMKSLVILTIIGALLISGCARQDSFDAPFNVGFLILDIPREDGELTVAVWYPTQE